MNIETSKMICDNDYVESIDTVESIAGLKGLPVEISFAKSRNRWYTNEEIAAILMKLESHTDWLTNEVQIRPKSGAILLYSRKQVRYRQDGYCWKKRKNGKTTREDHMKLKVQGIECIYGCYVHSAILPTFHRRCYWLLQNPDIVLVHYLNNSSNDQSKVQTFNAGLIMADTKRQWSDQEIMEEIGSMFGGVDEAYRMLTETTSSCLTIANLSNQLNNLDTEATILNKQAEINKNNNLENADCSDNKPICANQNMDVNTNVLFNNPSSHHITMDLNRDHAQSFSSKNQDNDGNDIGKDFILKENSNLLDDDGQDQPIISLSKLLNLDFNHASTNNHINSNQVNQDKNCNNSEISLKIINNQNEIALGDINVLRDNDNESRSEQLNNDELDDQAQFGQESISSQLNNNNGSPVSCIYNKIVSGMDTLTALPLDELHRGQQKDIHLPNHNQEHQQLRQQSNDPSSPMELSACDLLVAHDEEFLDQLANFGLPTLTGSSLCDTNPTADDLKDLILELTSVNNGTITDCDFVSAAANQTDHFHLDQLNQATKTNSTLTAQFNSKPIRPHTFELNSSTSMGMHHHQHQHQSTLSKAFSTDNWNVADYDIKSASDNHNLSNGIILKVESSSIATTPQPISSMDDKISDNISSSHGKRITLSTGTSTYSNCNGDDDAANKHLRASSNRNHQDSTIRNNFTRSCSAPSSTNDLLPILDYVPNWANTNGGSKVLIIGKWENIKLEQQEQAKNIGPYHRQNQSHQELSLLNRGWINDKGPSPTRNPYENENLSLLSAEGGSTNNFSILFDNITVPATQIQDNVLRCYAPLHDAGFVNMRVLLNGCVISEQVIFEYKPLCASRPMTNNGIKTTNSCQLSVSTHNQQQQQQQQLQQPYRQQLSPNSVKLSGGSLSSATSPSSVTPADTKVLTLAENIISAMHKKNFNPKNHQTENNQSSNSNRSNEGIPSTSTAVAPHCNLTGDGNSRNPVRPSSLASPRLTSSFDCTSNRESSGANQFHHHSLKKLGTSLSLTSKDYSMPSYQNTNNNNTNHIVMNQQGGTPSIASMNFAGQQFIDASNNNPHTFVDSTHVTAVPVTISDNINQSGSNFDTYDQTSSLYSNCNQQSQQAVYIQHPLTIITDPHIYRHQFQRQQQQQQQQQQQMTMLAGCSNTKSQMMLSHGTGMQNMSHDSQTETSSSGLGSILSSSPSSSLHSPLSIAPVDSPCSCGHQSSGTPTSADFCEYFQASAKAEKSFSCLTLSDYEQQELYEAAKIIQKAYRIYKGRKRQASDISVNVSHHQDSQHHRHLHHRLLNLGHHHHALHSSSYREKEMQAATIIQAYYRRYRQYVHYRQSRHQATQAMASSSNTSKSQSLSSISSVDENSLLHGYQRHRCNNNSIASSSSSSGNNNNNGNNGNNGNTNGNNIQHPHQLDHQLASTTTTAVAAAAAACQRKYSQSGPIVNVTNETCASLVVESLDISNVSSTAYIDRKRIKTAMVSSLNSKYGPNQIHHKGQQQQQQQQQQ